LRTYEALYIASPELDEDGIQTVVSSVEDLVTSNEGTIVRSENWGRRKLAYEVKGFSEGNYVLLRFTASPEFIAKLEASFKLNESIIRYLTVHLDARTLRLEEEQERRKQEELVRSSTRGSRDDDDDDEDDDLPPRGRRRHEDDDED
jgi:small subunit ribosomal protein S6